MTSETTRSFVVPGRPQSKERPRLYRGVAYTPQKTKDYEAKVRNAYVDAYPDSEPLDGDVVANFTIYFDKRNHGDIDNIIKCGLDGLNKVAFLDDKQVKELHGVLIVDKDEEQRMEIQISPLPTS